MDMTTLGTPSSEATVLASSAPSSTLATSSTRVGWFLLSRTTMRPSFSTDSTRPSTRSDIVRGPVSISPPGTVRFCCASAHSTSVAVRPAACSFSGSSHTFTCLLRPPRILSSPTPLMLSICRRTTLSASSVTSRMSPGAASVTKRIGADVRVELLDDRRVDALGELGEHVVDVVAHLLHGDVGVLLHVEQDDDARDAVGGRAPELVDAVDSVDGPLELVGDVGLDLLGGGAVEGRRDEDDRNVHVRELIDTKRRVAEGADHEEEQHHDPREDGLTDAE